MHPQPPPDGSLPFDDQTWRRVAEELRLAPQQERIVEQVLRGRQDREIAEQLGLAVPTVRTYLTRTFERLGVGDRFALLRYVTFLAMSR